MFALYFFLIFYKDVYIQIALIISHQLLTELFSISNGNEKMIDETSIDIGSPKESNLSTTTNSMFRVTSDTIQVSAALLPSLNVKYKVCYFSLTLAFS